VVFVDDQAAIDFVKAHQGNDPFIIEARKQSKTLNALIEGDGFLEELILRIEHLESESKSKSRRKYSRSIVDFYQRLLTPVDNVFSATGGSRKYLIENDDDKAELIAKTMNLRGDKSIEEWLQTQWMRVYHTDPNGIVFMEYTTEEIHGVDDVYPTYKSIGSIKTYRVIGQRIHLLLFEPKVLPEGAKLWRLVDDEKDYTIIESGDTFTVDQEHTFEHPFSRVPGIVNSNIQKVGEEFKESPIRSVVELSREYARDQSIKTIFKFQQGFPKMWRYEMGCAMCKGTGKSGASSESCKNCNGKGWLVTNDVTDVIRLKIPQANETVLAPNIMGFVSPDIDAWDQFTKELELLQDMASVTHWGTVIGVSEDRITNKTATEIVIMNKQPLENKLDFYSSTTEFMELQITNFIADFLQPTRDKEENAALIAYGRRYIIESSDMILKRYEMSKDKGDSTVILDRLYNEWITAKFHNDPIWLNVLVKKSNIEPYLHYTAEQVGEIFNQKQARKKVQFRDWWEEQSKDFVFKSTEKELKASFDSWFETNQIKNSDE